MKQNRKPGAIKAQDRVPRSDNSKVLSHLSVSILAIFFVMALAQFKLDGFSGLLADGLFRTQWWRTPSPDVALIAYDDESSRRYGGLLKIPAQEIAQVYKFLASEKAKSVALLTEVSDQTYSPQELATIAQSMKAVPNSYVGYLADDSLGKAPPPVMANAATYLPGYVSRDTFSYGADSVTRRVMIEIDGISSLYAYLAGYPGARETLPSYHINQSGQTRQTYINWQGPAGTYVPISSESIVLGSVPHGTFTGKTVLFGSQLHYKRGDDFIYTPFSREPNTTPLLEGAANSLVTLARRDDIRKSSFGMNILISLVVALLTVNMVAWLSPGTGILFVFTEVAGLAVLGWLALFIMHLWIDLAHPAIIAFMGYYLVVPYRLVYEYRKRWHYQEKSELMAQLEQLKSNFLSLISHDLKTPIARIQGNAELLLGEPQQLNPKQAKYLSAIVHTTEDLGQYVETVLDLTRIESARVPLNITTKDINASIKEVVESKREMAAEKNIALATELEPLFSIKFDVKLIRRVLSNLVENAIKYSPDNSQIVLSSREEDNWIRIAVSDQGVGIDPAQHGKVFEKFYRCENENTREIKGTGLGLYLVKYFVELHQGVVELKSELGKGSTFTISLPV